MKKLFCNLIFIILTFCAFAQDSRDNIIGTYNVKVQADHAGTIYTDTLTVSKDINNISQIFIWYPNNGGGVYYIFDSTSDLFYDPNFPSLRYGGFYPNDSIFIHDHLFNSTAPFYYEYWGFKTSGSTGVNELVSDPGFMLYPNPASSKLNILAKNVNGNLKVRLIDIAGKEVYGSAMDLNNGQSFSINTAAFDKGIYFVVLESEQGRQTKRVVIE